MSHVYRDDTIRYYLFSPCSAAPPYQSLHLSGFEAWLYCDREAILATLDVCHVGVSILGLIGGPSKQISLFISPSLYIYVYI